MFSECHDTEILVFSALTEKEKVILIQIYLGLV